MKWTFFCFAHQSGACPVEDGEKLNILKSGSGLARFRNLDRASNLPGFQCRIFPSVTQGMWFNVSVKFISFLIC